MKAVNVKTRECDTINVYGINTWNPKSKNIRDERNICHPSVRIKRGREGRPTSSLTERNGDGRVFRGELLS